MKLNDKSNQVLLIGIILMIIAAAIIYIASVAKLMLLIFAGIFLFCTGGLTLTISAFMVLNKRAKKELSEAEKLDAATIKQKKNKR